MARIYGVSRANYKNTSDGIRTLRSEVTGLVLYVNGWDFHWPWRALKAERPGPSGSGHPLHRCTPDFHRSSCPAHLSRRFSSNLEAFVPSTTVGRTYFSIQNLTKVSTSTFELSFPSRSNSPRESSTHEMNRKPLLFFFFFTKLRYSIRWSNDTRIRSRTNISSLRSSPRYSDESAALWQNLVQFPSPLARFHRSNSVVRLAIARVSRDRYS